MPHNDFIEEINWWDCNQVGLQQGILDINYFGVTLSTLFKIVS